MCHKELVLVNLVLGRLACRDTLLELFNFISLDSLLRQHRLLLTM
jgi:hypothetical protein